MILMIEHRNPSNHSIVVHDQISVLRGEMISVEPDLDLFIPPEHVLYILTTG